MPGGAFRSAAEPARFEAVLDSLNEIVFETDAEGNWTYLNQAWQEITGFEVERSLGRNFLEWVHPDEREATIELFTNVVKGLEDYCHHQTRYLTAGGTYRWLELRAAVLYDDTGQVDGNAGVLMDISDRRRAEEQLAEEAHILEMIARGTPLEQTLGILAAMLARHLGGTAEVRVLSHPQTSDPPRASERAEGPAIVAQPDGALELRPPGSSSPDTDEAGIAQKVPILASDGRAQLGWVVIAQREVAPGSSEEALVERCAALVAIAVERQRAEETATYQALHDPLTGLPNRTLYTERLRETLSAALRQRRPVALLMLDLDHFKMINDTLGHEAGDQVLRDVGARLRAALGQNDTACRLGGDEFAIVLADLSGEADAWSRARRLYAMLREPLDVQGVKLHLQCTMGVATSSLLDDGQPADLLRQADAAMYRAKRDGEGLVQYDPRSDAERLRGINLASELGHALDNDQFVLHYQPKVDLRRGQVVGVEALLRWQHPVRGTVLPSLFVPLAETSAAIKPLSMWVLRTALADGRRWREEGLDVSVAVNLSARILHDAELPDLVGEALAHERTDGRQLELEITESALMVDPARAMRAMSRLDAAGVMFSIDDFGTGYSSLSYLKRLPARSLKIDQSFVRDMDTDERDASIVRSAIELGHNLGMGVVAEGVERMAVWNLLEELHCDVVQGFHVARPMPNDELLGWLHQHAANC